MNIDHSKDGMRYPSIDVLLDKTESKYVLVVGAAKRAKAIKKEGTCLVENPYNKKTIGIALEEIYTGKILIKKIND
ncbi:MAG: DNA-directed RNA polymerase subunit omega [Bacilli bacterium]|jgi:DNA-directed RNA polymerase subunit omega|nr:DNA-directed RNA polymerase subunit omega [Bacilli bacterium]MDD2681447.1 DNA-directed RNA polymerase subunit omega [Bacilli bacterium]MDD3121230.1 DNA-directed RNA polymerase subunit omega [Bacilli bacterium]MDD4062871.1 DNA-directed RNA polymerase subunit omega [Bacilli bacterium]MDD4481922.1 DNA-directed RNA polymerase subunit omega [Bacilli bacterium]